MFSFHFSGWFCSHFLAPGDYKPERSATFLLDKSPKYSFGMKTCSEKPSQTPGELFNLVDQHFILVAQEFSKNGIN